MCLDDLWPVNPVRLAVVMNYSMLLSQSKDQIDDAIFLVETIIESAYSFIDDKMEDEKTMVEEETMVLIDDLKRNLEMWYEQKTH